MLVELAVRDLGVIADLRIAFGPSMTALTGETGAGKTMIVEALSLLGGGRSDPSRVRGGAAEAVIEALFVEGDDEVVVRRVIPAVGRSRSYLDGKLATAATLAERVGPLIEICGQHGSVRLAELAAQRSALDRFGSIDTSAWTAALTHRRRLDAELASLGGDEQARARELDLLRYQLAELTTAAVSDADEDRRLDAEEDELASAETIRNAARTAAHDLSADDGVREQVRRLAALLEGPEVLSDIAERLIAVRAELDDVATELRQRAERLVDSPERLAEVGARRHLLADLRRKYGPELADVIEFQHRSELRLAEMDSVEDRIAAVELALTSARSAERVEALAVGAARRRAAESLGEAVTGRLNALAMQSARFVVRVGDEADDPAGERVEMLLSTSRELEPGPLSRVASGGELSRVLLALHLVVSDRIPTLVFDEVDTGVGGATATAVGDALAQLACDHQVLVVTHLPQVAAVADVQMVVERSDDGSATTSKLVALDHGDRVIELSRMMSGDPHSEHARRHADELLAGSSRRRDR